MMSIKLKETPSKSVYVHLTEKLKENLKRFESLYRKLSLEDRKQVTQLQVDSGNLLAKLIEKNQ